MNQGKNRWTAAADLSKSFGYKAGIGQGPTRLALLTTAWDKEVGHFRAHWQLEGVRKGILYVRARSPAGAQELALRSAEILKALNKYFQRPWLKGIKHSLGQRPVALPPEPRRTGRF